MRSAKWVTHCKIEELLALLATHLACGGAIDGQRAAGLLSGHDVSQSLLRLLHQCHISL